MNETAAPSPGEPTSPPSAAQPRRRQAWPWARRLAALGVAIVAALVVVIVSVDLGRVAVGGRSLRSLAEEAASEYLERPMHIGAISAKLTPGAFELHNVVIEGRSPSDRPFIQAGRIRVEVPWWTLLRSDCLLHSDCELVLQVTMVDWRMVVETWPDGPYRHNLPRLTPRRRDTPSEPRPFRTTVRFVYARNGEFVYDDHGAPWSVVAPNLDFNLVHSDAVHGYLGNARFTGGTVRIQDFEPMRADMTTRFSLDGSLVRLQHIDLVTDGAVSHVNGFADFGNWPSQQYNVSSTVDFPRMRELFFSDASWRVRGEGQFRGVFQFFPEGGRSLAGEFWSERASVNALDFPDLHGTLEWLPDRFAVTHAEAELYGGTTQFSYSLLPLGTPRGATAAFRAAYEDVQIAQLLEASGLEIFGLEGQAAGHLDLQWPNGRFGSARLGSGRTVVTPPAETTLAPPVLPVGGAVPFEPGPFDPRRPMAQQGLGADLRYRLAERLVFEDSWAATPTTYVSFSGGTAYDAESEMPFHVTSLDWQASDRLLAAILTAFGSPTNAVEVGGRGAFDGTMTGTFRAPRIAGRFTSEGMRVWGVTWGATAGDIVIENSYVEVADGVIGDPSGVNIRANGRFSLGFPRRDAGEEIDAQVLVAGWPLADLRHAFGLDDWPVDGTVGQAALRLHGFYRGPFGTGRLRIDDGVAWGETFETATGTLAFEGTGLRITAVDMAKDTGTIDGSAWLGWDGTYAFDAGGYRIPVQSLDVLRSDARPLTGLLGFRANGNGALDSPVYELSATVPDLGVGEEGIGALRVDLTVANDQLTIVRLGVTGSRVQVDGQGRIALDDVWHSELQLSFLDTSIDPYLKFFVPTGSPFTRIIAFGRVRIAGALADPSDLLVDATIDDTTITMFDYDVRNDGPIRLTFEHEQFRIGRLQFTGPETELALTGGVDAAQERVDVTAEGQANLAIMQLFFSDLSASGAADLSARIVGSLDEPSVLGQANVADGRIRQFSLPHSLTGINGPIRFDPSGINVNGLRARMGDGDVTFAGSIVLRGYVPDEFNLEARGSSMRLRYPEGFLSTVDADLRLTGPLGAPLLSGVVEVLSVTYLPSLDDQASLFGLAGGAGLGGGAGDPRPAGSSAFPLQFDIAIDVPPTAFIRHREATVEGGARLRFSGSLDQPSLTGQVEIERGEVFFQGNRYLVRRGTIDFVNPTRIEPIFDIEAESRPRASGQTFTVTAQISGTFERLALTLTSDPWLPDVEIMALLLGGTPDLGRAEQLALTSPDLAQERLLQTVGAILLTSPLSSRIGTAFTDVLPIETVQITPVLGYDDSGQQLNPTARVTLGKRISSRVFLTFSRAFDASSAEIILLEYEQNDRMSWILSRNEDRTFALDFRIRHAF